MASRWVVRVVITLGLVADAGVAQTPADTVPRHPDDLPMETTDTLRFTAREGSWMSVDVSPDGSTVVFDLLGDLYTVPLAGGAATRLTFGQPWDAQPRYSPDGSRIVFVSDRSGSKNLWTLEVATGEMKAVTRDASSAFMSPDWLDDEYLVVSKGTRLGGGLLQVLHVDGGEGRRLFGDPQPPPPNRAIHVSGAAPSPDGRYIWYTQAVGRWDYNAMFPEAQLGVYDRETGSTHSETSRYGSGFRPTLSPDGKWLVYGTRHETETALRIRNLDTGDEAWLAYPVQHDELESSGEVDVLPGMAFTPDSRELVASYGGKIWRVPVDGSDATEVPFRAAVELPLAPSTHTRFRVDDRPAFVAKEIRDLAPSPDGRRLAFVTMDRLYVTDVEGGDPVQLTPDSLSVAWPTWSPDGQRLAVAAWTPDGGSLVAVAADGGGGIQVLTRRAAFYATPAWSPDGGRIVALRGPRRPFLLTSGPATQGQAPDLVWVPAEGGDDTYIAPAQGRGAPHFVEGSDRIHLYSGGSGIVSIRWDGTDERGVVRVVGPPAAVTGMQPVPADVAYLSPDGTKALAHVHNELFVVDVPLVGGATPTVNVASPSFPVQRLTEMGAQFPAWGAGGAAVHWGLGNAHFRYDLAAGRAFADSVEAAAAAEPGDDEEDPQDGAGVDGDEAATYQPAERRIEVRATRDIPRGAVLLQGARVVTMRGDEVLERGDVLVRDNRIAAVGPSGSLQVPEGARVLDLRGATIVPGYVDTHAHLNGTFGIHKNGVWAYEANLAYGVTTVRDPQTGTTDVLSYADRVEAGEILGPRVYSTGPGVFGDYVTEKIRSLDHARDVLRRYADYFDTKTIKMYMAGSRKERQWIAQAARDVGLMPTTEGGLRWQQDLTMMVDGYAGQEHNLPVFPIYSDVVQLAARTRIAYTPTLVVTYNGPWAENYYFTTEDLMGDEKLWRFVPREDLEGKVRRRIRPYLGQGPWGGWFLDEEYTFPRHARFVSDLMDAGGLVGVGSHGQLQGLGYHWELWSIQSGGLSEHGALRAATLAGAEAIGLAEDLGSIEAGKLADLVILTANPLENIRNSREIRYVMKNGRLYDGGTLDEIWPRSVPFQPSWQGEGEPRTRAGVREGGGAEVLLGPPLSLPDSHEGPSFFDEEGGRFYFTRASADWASSRVLVSAGSGAPQPAPFSTGPYDAGLTRAPRGDLWIFTSKRATGQTALPDEWNLWGVSVEGADPAPLPEPVNSAASECCAAFAPDGSFLFSSDRDGNWDIYRAVPAAGGAWTVHRPEGTLNSEHHEWPSWVSPDGALVLFNSMRAGGFGGDDLFAACRQGGGDRWDAVRLPATVNTAGYEDSGMLTPDGRAFYWSGRRPGPDGSAEVLRMDADEVGLPHCAEDVPGGPASLSRPGDPAPRSAGWPR